MVTVLTFYSDDPSSNPAEVDGKESGKGQCSSSNTGREWNTSASAYDTQIITILLKNGTFTTSLRFIFILFKRLISQALDYHNGPGIPNLSTALKKLLNGPISA